MVVNFNFRHGAKKYRSIRPPVSELWLSLNLAVKEQNERVYKCDDSCNFFCDSCKFAFSQLDFMPRGMIWKFSRHFQTPFSPPKEWFLSKKGPKEGERVARGHFHERVGESPVHWLPPGVGFTQKPFSVFRRTVQLKISLGPIRFLYSKFHGLLKLIFHTNQYNGA